MMIRKILEYKEKFWQWIDIWSSPGWPIKRQSDRVWHYRKTLRKLKFADDWNEEQKKIANKILWDVMSKVRGRKK